MLRARMDEDRLRVLNWMEKKKKEEEELSTTFDMVDNGEGVTDNDQEDIEDDLNGEDLPDLHDLPGKQVWKHVVMEPHVGPNDG